MTFGHRGGILVAGLFSVNAIALACAPALKTGPGRQESGWPAYLGNQRHDAAAHETLNPDPRPLWHVGMGRGVRGSPALGESVVAVGTADRNLVLVDRSSGDVLWRSHLDGSVRAGPLLDEDRLYIATESQPQGRVYAIRLRDGRQLWRSPAGSVTAPLAFDGEGIYAGTEEGLVLRLEPERGKVEWRRPLSGAEPALAQPHLLLEGTRELADHALQALVGGLVQLNAQKGETLADAGPDGGGVLADPRCEGEGVDASQSARHGRDGLRDAVAVDVERQPRLI